MIKFVMFDAYTTNSKGVGSEVEAYAAAAIVINKITSIVEVREAGGVAFTFIYLMEPAGDGECNYFKVKGTLEQTMLTIMAADAEHEQLPAVEKWAPINYREED